MLSENYATKFSRAICSADLAFQRSAALNVEFQVKASLEAADPQEARVCATVLLISNRYFK